MLQLGWALIVFGFTPWIMMLIGRRIEAVVGPNMYWMSVAPPGVCVLLLALLPTDARAIRTICAVSFANVLSFGLYFLAYILRNKLDSNLHVAMKVLWLGVDALLLATAAAVAPTLPCGGCTRLPVMQPRQALRQLWRTARLLMGGLGVLCIGVASTLMAASDVNLTYERERLAG